MRGSERRQHNPSLGGVLKLDAPHPNLRPCHPLPPHLLPNTHPTSSRPCITSNPFSGYARVGGEPLRGEKRHDSITVAVPGDNLRVCLPHLIPFAGGVGGGPWRWLGREMGGVMCRPAVNLMLACHTTGQVAASLHISHAGSWARARSRAARCSAEEEVRQVGVERVLAHERRVPRLGVAKSLVEV